MKKLIFALWVIMALLPFARAAHKHSEAYYQNEWCSNIGGVQEYENKDYTRVDCLTDTHAIEFDFAKKWAESIGQSLHYSRMTGKKAGIVLIIEDEKDYRYYERMQPLCEELGIDLWVYENIKKAP